VDPDIAPVNSLKGRLQRGRGQGFLDCIVSDPRWDSQVESRAAYYADLAQRLSLGTRELAGHLFGPEDDKLRDEDRTGLTLAVLQELGRRGGQDAVATLRRYVVEGWNWEWALESLAALDFPQATEGLGDAIERRFENEEALIGELRGATVPELWTRWAESNPRLEEGAASDRYRARRCR
jgi:hypothetical protein